MKDTLKAAWNHAGSMFATFWIVGALYALGFYLVWAFLQLDAQFSRPLAGDVIPANVTQQIAWGTRAFSVIAGSMAIYFHVKDMPQWRRIFSILTAVAALILLLHAYGIAAKIMQGQYDNDAVIEQVATIDKGSIQAEIDDLIAERDGLPALTDSTVATFQRSIDSITNDGLDNDDEAQEFADKQVAAIEARDARLAAIRTELTDKRKELRDASSEEKQDKAKSDSFNPLFVFGARLSSGTWNPSDTPPDVHMFVWGVAFFTLFFGFGEILMMVAFTGGYAALKVVSERTAADEKDPVRVEAGKKAAKTRNRRKRQTDKIEEQAESYMKRWKHAVRLAKNTKYTAKGIAETAFKQGDMEHAITIMKRAGLITDEEIRLVKRSDQNLPAVANPNAVDVINPDPATTNGSGKPLNEGADDAVDSDTTGAVSSN